MRGELRRELRAEMDTLCIKPVLEVEKDIVFVTQSINVYVITRRKGVEHQMVILRNFISEFELIIRKIGQRNLICKQPNNQIEVTPPSRHVDITLLPNVALY